MFHTAQDPRDGSDTHSQRGAPLSSSSLARGEGRGLWSFQFPEAYIVMSFKVAETEKWGK